MGFPSGLGEAALWHGGGSDAAGVTLRNGLIGGVRLRMICSLLRCLVGGAAHSGHVAG